MPASPRVRLECWCDCGDILPTDQTTPNTLKTRLWRHWQLATITAYGHRIDRAIYSIIVVIRYHQAWPPLHSIALIKCAEWPSPLTLINSICFRNLPACQVLLKFNFFETSYLGLKGANPRSRQWSVLGSQVNHWFQWGLTQFYCNLSSYHVN